MYESKAPLLAACALVTVPNSTILIFTSIQKGKEVGDLPRQGISCNNIPKVHCWTNRLAGNRVSCTHTDPREGKSKLDGRCCEV